MYVRVHIIMIKKIPNKQTINTHSNTKTHTKYTQKTNGKQKKKNSAEILPCYCVDNNKISKIVYISFVRYICSINSKVYMLKYALTTISI